jgi:hypothetical protein
MSRSKQTAKGSSRRRAVTAWGVAGALSLAAGGASASIGPARDIPTKNTAPVFTLGEEEISDVSLATFYVFEKENAGAHRPGVQLAARAWDVAAGAVQCTEAAPAAPCTEAAAAAQSEDAEAAAVSGSQVSGSASSSSSLRRLRRAARARRAPGGGELRQAAGLTAPKGRPLLSCWIARDQR